LHSNSHQEFRKPRSLQKTKNPLTNQQAESGYCFQFPLKLGRKLTKFSNISKKNNKKTLEKKDVSKSYTQASSPSTSKILKLKETFLKLL